jgi:hypothetical protein
MKRVIYLHFNRPELNHLQKKSAQIQSASVHSAYFRHASSPCQPKARLLVLGGMDLSRRLALFSAMAAPDLAAVLAAMSDSARRQMLSAVSIEHPELSADALACLRFAIVHTRNCTIVSMCPARLPSVPSPRNTHHRPLVQAAHLLGPSRCPLSSTCCQPESAREQGHALMPSAERTATLPQSWAPNLQSLG